MPVKPRKPLHVVILRGIPGSGKSRLARKLAPRKTGVICSADDFFMRSGRYVFDGSKLGEAHNYCLRKFLHALGCQLSVIVVDNTGTSVAEVAPYAALALAHGATLEIITVKCSVRVAAKRNVHGVPRKAVAAMARRLKEEGKRLPPWWSHKTA